MESRQRGYLTSCIIFARVCQTDNAAKIIALFRKPATKKEDDTMKAIVYTSNTGSSKAYAEMLGAKTALPVFAWDDDVKTLDNGTGIL